MIDQAYVAFLRHQVRPDSSPHFIERPDRDDLADRRRQYEFWGNPYALVVVDAAALRRCTATDDLTRKLTGVEQRLSALAETLLFRQIEDREKRVLETCAKCAFYDLCYSGCMFHSLKDSRVLVEKDSRAAPACGSETRVSHPRAPKRDRAVTIAVGRLSLFGWSREQAMDYLRTRAALSEHEITTEVERYIAWPGQALAYKPGAMQIRRHRREAEEKLGSKFGQRHFHDHILALGSVPLPVLEARMAQFIVNGGVNPTTAPRP